MAPDRGAALLVRVWLEGDPGTEAFRARLTTVGTTGGTALGREVTIAVAASPAEVLDAVRHWLDEFVGTRSPPD